MLNQHQTNRDNIAKYNKPNPLADFLIPLIGDKKKVSILDVGSGAYSIIGSYLEGVDVSIHHVDNQDFTDYYKKYNFLPIVKIWREDMENLSVPNDSFDIVVCLNALDHTNNALKAVGEMIRACKSGGTVYIDCHLDQKETGHKHKWNVKEDGTVTNGEITFHLTGLGFKINYIDKGGERRYNHITAVLQK